MHYQTEWWNRIKRKVWLGKKKSEIGLAVGIVVLTKEKEHGTHNAY